RGRFRPVLEVGGRGFIWRRSLDEVAISGPTTDRGGVMNGTLPAQARVVIVGGGIVGCSLVYYLTRLGWCDVVVLDQGPLFVNWGSTSYAPGLMFQHNASPTLCVPA